MKSVLALVLILAPSATAPAITIETVPIGDLGNPNDPATANRYGGVSYAYSIGKYDVTVGQYVEFLNAVAKTDTFGLYNPHMTSDLNSASISRSGASGSYVYSVIGSANHPATYFSWGDAVRFANWLHNGQPTGAQTAATTEDGAYALNGATSNVALTSITRKAGAKWYIPTVSEWYKAAYYQPASKGGDSDGYWAYPMKTNNTPYSDQPPGATPDNTRVANFYQDDVAANGYNDGYATSGSTTYSISQDYLTDVGAYASSPSYYGTYDQGGNVFQWLETLVLGAYRDARGGGWTQDGTYLAAATPNSYAEPAGEYGDFGLRLGTVVPEPATLSLLVVGALARVRTRRLRIG